MAAAGHPVSCCHGAEAQDLCCLPGLWVGSLGACWGAGSLRLVPAAVPCVRQSHTWDVTYVCTSSDVLTCTSHTPTPTGYSTSRPLWGVPYLECGHSGGLSFNLHFPGFL